MDSYTSLIPHFNSNQYLDVTAVTVGLFYQIFSAAELLFYAQPNKWLELPDWLVAQP